MVLTIHNIFTWLLAVYNGYMSNLYAYSIVYYVIMNFDVVY